MFYILDTNHCIYLQNGIGRKPEKRKIEEINIIKNVLSIEKKDNLFMSVVTLGELFFGAANSQNKEKNLKRLEILKEIVIPIDLDIEIWKIFGELRART